MGESAQGAFDVDIRYKALSARIVPLRQRQSRQRLELIGAVVDAFARLQNSVLRLISTLAQDDRLDGVGQASGSPRFDELLSSLAAHAEQTGFRRLPELKRFIPHAVLAEAHRDVIFLHSPVADEEALRKAANALEHLDTTLVGLCVEHVLEHRTQQSSPRPAHDSRRISVQDAPAVN